MSRNSEHQYFNFHVLKEDQQGSFQNFYKEAKALVLCQRLAAQKRCYEEIKGPLTLVTEKNIVGNPTNFDITFAYVDAAVDPRGICSLNSCPGSKNRKGVSRIWTSPYARNHSTP